MVLSTLTPVLRAGSTTARFGPNKCLAECILKLLIRANCLYVCAKIQIL
ncbi:hypothetical protein Psfp_01310 [Pelotomaculum sp. FP]|nr:hypothetical protein Psfp_01310 [Pelotomaculum sp. FP]